MAVVSTLGAEADELAARRRAHERRVTQKKMTLRDCVAFCIVTLTDRDVPDDVARRTVLEALRHREGGLMDLYPFQKDCVARTLVAIDTAKNSLVVVPTGGGKTVIAGGIIRVRENKHILRLTHRRELVFQPEDKLRAFDIASGLILSGEKMNQMARVQIASIQTLHSRCVRGSVDLPRRGHQGRDTGE